MTKSKATRPSKETTPSTKSTKKSRNSNKLGKKERLERRAALSSDPEHLSHLKNIAGPTVDLLRKYGINSKSEFMKLSEAEIFELWKKMRKQEMELKVYGKLPGDKERIFPVGLGHLKWFIAARRGQVYDKDTFKVNEEWENEEKKMKEAFNEMKALSKEVKETRRQKRAEKKLANREKFEKEVEERKLREALKREAERQRMELLAGEDDSVDGEDFSDSEEED